MLCIVKLNKKLLRKVGKKKITASECDLFHETDKILLFVAKEKKSEKIGIGIKVDFIQKLKKINLQKNKFYTLKYFKDVVRQALNEIVFDF